MVLDVLHLWKASFTAMLCHRTLHVRCHIRLSTPVLLFLFPQFADICLWQWIDDKDINSFVLMGTEWELEKCRNKSWLCYNYMSPFSFFLLFFFFFLVTHLFPSTQYQVLQIHLHGPRVFTRQFCECVHRHSKKCKWRWLEPPSSWDLPTPRSKHWNARSITHAWWTRKSPPCLKTHVSTKA